MQRFRAVVGQTAWPFRTPNSAAIETRRTPDDLNPTEPPQSKIVQIAHTIHDLKPSVSFSCFSALSPTIRTTTCGFDGLFPDSFETVVPVRIVRNARLKNDSCQPFLNSRVTFSRIVSLPERRRNSALKNGADERNSVMNRICAETTLGTPKGSVIGLLISMINGDQLRTLDSRRFPDRLD